MRKLLFSLLFASSILYSFGALTEKTVSLDFSTNSYNLSSVETYDEETINLDGIDILITQRHQYSSDGYLYLLPKYNKNGMIRIKINDTKNPNGVIKKVSLSFVNPITITTDNSGNTSGLYLEKPDNNNRKFYYNYESTNISYDCYKGSNTPTQKETLLYIIGDYTEFLEAKFKKIDITYTTEEEEEPAPSAPIISPAPGTYFTAQTITITSDTSNKIYYTTDGNTPTSSSNEYSAPFTIDKSQTIKAIAVSPSNKISEIAEADYKFSQEYTSISDIINLPIGSPATIATALTVIYQKDEYICASDNSSNVIIKGNLNNTYNNGDVIKSGLCGTIESIDGHRVFKLTSTDQKVTAITPSNTTIQNILASPINGQFVAITKCSFSQDDLSSTIAQDESTILVENLFGITTPKSRSGSVYTITGFVSIKDNIAYIIPTEISNDVSTISAFPQTDDSINLYSNNGEIIINEQTNDINIYTTAGKLLSKGKNRIKCSAGLYVVKVGDRIAKIIVK